MSGAGVVAVLNHQSDRVSPMQTLTNRSRAIHTGSPTKDLAENSLGLGEASIYTAMTGMERGNTPAGDKDPREVTKYMLHQCNVSRGKSGSY